MEPEPRTQEHAAFSLLSQEEEDDECDESPTAGHDGRGSTSVLGARKREAAASDDEEEVRRGGQQDEDTANGPSAFLALPEGVHRLIASFVCFRGIRKLLLTCNSLGPVYRSGIWHLAILRFRFLRPRAPLEPEVFVQSLVGFLGRLSHLKVINIREADAVELFASAALAAASAAEPPRWMMTLQVLLMEFLPFGMFGDVPEDELEESAHAHLVTLFGLLGQGAWPRLHTLKLGGKPLLERGMGALAAALEGRGDGCSALRSLEIIRNSTGLVRTSVWLRDEEAVGRLLAASCCRALKRLGFGEGVNVDTACLSRIVAHLRSPAGRQIESLICRWILTPVEMEEGVPDPTMLVRVLTDGCLPRLTTLELSYLLPSCDEEEAPGVAMALQQWAQGPLSQKLQSLKCRVWPGLLAPLMEGVRTGHGFPKLKRLFFLLVPGPDGGSAVEELCQSIEAGALRSLESLVLQGLPAGGLGRLMQSLAHPGTRCSSKLTWLQLANCGASDEEGWAVGAALAAGAFPKLEALDLSGSPRVGDRTARAIVEALRGGAATRLKELHFDKTSLGDEGCLALCALMRESGTSALTTLYFKDSEVTGRMGRRGYMKAKRLRQADGTTHVELSDGGPVSDEEEEEESDDEEDAMALAAAAEEDDEEEEGEEAQEGFSGLEDDEEDDEGEGEAQDDEGDEEDDED